MRLDCTQFLPGRSGINSLQGLSGLAVAVLSLRVAASKGFVLPEL